jgi:hypothetical protein
MRAYVVEQAEELACTGKSIAPILPTVEQTPFAAQVIRNFARLVETRT